MFFVMSFLLLRPLKVRGSLKASHMTRSFSFPQLSFFFFLNAMIDSFGHDTNMYHHLKPIVLNAILLVGADQIDSFILKTDHYHLQLPSAHRVWL